MRSTSSERRQRARKIVQYVKKTYPEPKTELAHTTPFQLVASVMLSAQCTDKKVNAVTKTLWKKYKSVKDFANMDVDIFSSETASITYHRTKARHINLTARMVLEEYKGRIPKTEADLVRFPGIAYKTAHVVLGELYGIWEGIPTDTHVRRFALRFDLTDHTELTKISKDLEALIPKEDWRYVNNGLVLYGRYVCTAIPHDCGAHPLTRIWPKAAHRWPKAK